MKSCVKAFCSICLLFAVLYLIATADLAYGYYTFIRVLSLFGMLVLGFLWLMIAEKPLSPIMIVLTVILVLFNPIIPIYLDKETWIVLDTISAFTLLVVGGYVWFTKKDLES